MTQTLIIPSPLQKLEDPLFHKKQIEVYIKRDDLIHPEISGNKWRKLKYNLEKFKSGKYDSLLTFGGAYSNHIAATASAGQLFQIPCIGIVRGDELNEKSNHTLRRAHENGMKLIFVPREIYDQRYERIYHEELRGTHGNILIIEEGGANFLGVQGVAEIIKELPFQPDYIYTASGTGTTATGLLLGSDKTKVSAVSVLKNGNFLTEEINRLLYTSLFENDLVAETMTRLNLNVNYDFGGYGKYTDELLTFINEWTEKTTIPLDQVYTGKMMYAFYQDVINDKIEPKSKVVLLHTGGIQGILQ